MNFEIYYETLKYTYKYVLSSPSTKYHLWLRFDSNTYEYTAITLLNIFLENINTAFIKNDNKISDQALEGFVIKQRTDQLNNLQFEIIFFDPDNKLPDRENFDEIIATEIMKANRLRTSDTTVTEHIIKDYYHADENSRLEQYLIEQLGQDRIAGYQTIKRICPLCAGNVSFAN